MTLSDIKWNLILGGLGLFLYGIKVMGDGLTKASGSKIRDYIDRYTTNPIMAVMVGMILTGVIQSSSGTTVIAISLVRSGLMKLEQAIGIMLGANIGTSVTAILIGFNLEEISYYILFIGVIVIYFGKRRVIENLGMITIGFAIIFIGLQIMGNELSNLQQVEGFDQVMATIADKPWLSLSGGTAITAIIQSSSAIIGIVQKMYEAGSIQLIAALALMFGANIGTTITSVLASIGGSLAARRSSLFHILFNVIWSIIFMVFLNQYTSAVLWLQHNVLNGNPKMAIAVSHFGFNFIGAIIFIPLIPWASMMLHKVLPGSDRILSDIEIEEFDESLITSMPVVALDMVKRTTLKMGELAIEGIRSSHRFLSEKDPIAQDEVMQLEEIINSIDTKTTAYLLKIAKQDISEELMEEYATNLQVVKNLERISDLSTNLIEYYDLLYENKSSFTEESVEAIDQLYEQLIHMITRSLESYEHNDLTIHNQLIEEEAYMDLLEAQARNRYFARITKNPEIVNVASSVFIDIITTLERMGDHAFNISALTFSPTKLHPPKEMHYQ